MSNVKNNHFRFQEIFREVWGFEPLALMDLNGTIEMQYPTTIVSTQRKNEEKMDLAQIASMFETGVGVKISDTVFRPLSFHFRP